MSLHLALAALLSLLPTHVVAQAVADLSGTWRLDANASDTGGTNVDDGSGPKGGRTPLGGLGMPGRQPLGGYGSPGGMAAPEVVNPERRKQQVELVRELLAPVLRFTIEQDATSVSFTYDDGRTVRYRVDGKAEKHQAIHDVVETETRWKKGKLVRETHLDDGSAIEETFSVTPSRTLVVEIKSTGGPGHGKPVRRVYELVQSSQ